MDDRVFTIAALMILLISVVVVFQQENNVGLATQLPDEFSSNDLSINEQVRDVELLEFTSLIAKENNGRAAIKAVVRNNGDQTEDVEVSGNYGSLLFGRSGEAGNGPEIFQLRAGETKELIYPIEGDFHKYLYSAFRINIRGNYGTDDQNQSNNQKWTNLPHHWSFCSYSSGQIPNTTTYPRVPTHFPVYSLMRDCRFTFESEKVLPTPDSYIDRLEDTPYNILLYFWDFDYSTPEAGAVAFVQKSSQSNPLTDTYISPRPAELDDGRTISVYRRDDWGININIQGSSYTKNYKDSLHAFTINDLTFIPTNEGSAFHIVFAEKFEWSGTITPEVTRHIVGPKNFIANKSNFCTYTEITHPTMQVPEIGNIVCYHDAIRISEADHDGDGLLGLDDNCPLVSNPDQLDSDNDLIGDKCDPNDTSNFLLADQCPDDRGKESPGACGCGTPDIDSDGDGALDCVDICPLNSEKTVQNICGCDQSDADSDNDGIVDCEDQCPYDSTKTQPGICGCNAPDDLPQTDLDGDSFVGCQDICKDDPNKQNPGLCGCGVVDSSTDRDGDGIVDCQDQCPSYNKMSKPNECGLCSEVFEEDIDSDGFTGCQDICYSDPLKQEPGQCGCNNFEDGTDSDGDGYQDCAEHCDFDPLKTLNGICGCGIPDTDSDGDGQVDCNDACPDDPKKKYKIHIGKCGCGFSERVEETDVDDDGISGCQDQCPFDRLKTMPGQCGCGTIEDLSDDDGDGILNCVDLCPLDAEQSSPGTCGCGAADIDSDEDGTLDCFDECPLDENKITRGMCGCGETEVDSDDDGTPDCVDICAQDPLKSVEGICGCGIEDIDTDFDNVLDCEDTCSLDPAKIEPGMCGCGIPDLDSDNDGTYDCEDQCSEDPNKTTSGSCGCGSPDIDTDQDGVLDCFDQCPENPELQIINECGCNGEYCIAEQPDDTEVIGGPRGGDKDSLTKIVGDESSITKKGIQGTLNILIDQQEDLTQTFSGLKKIEIKEDGKTLFDFEYDFTDKSLDLNFEVEKETINSGSLVRISNLPLDENENKTIYVEKISSSSTGLCIYDQANTSNYDPDCKAENHTFLVCSQQANSTTFNQNTYTCLDNTTHYIVSGLKHSLVFETEDEAVEPDQPEVPKKTGGGGGGGGSSSRTFTQSEPTVCIEEWVCGTWSKCMNGTQIKECDDFQGCGTTTLKPSTTRECTIEVIEAPASQSENTTQESNLENQLDSEEQPIPEKESDSIEEESIKIPLIIMSIVVLLLLSGIIFWLKTKPNKIKSTPAYSSQARTQNNNLKPVSESTKNAKSKTQVKLNKASTLSSDLDSIGEQFESIEESLKKL